MDGLGVGVRENERKRGSLDRLQRGAFAGVRAVHDDTRIVQPAHQVAAETGEAGIARFLATVTHAIADVVGELHHAHAKRVKGVHEVEVVPDRVGALEVEHQAEFLPLLGFWDLSGALDQLKIGPRCDEPVPAAEVAQRFLSRCGAAHGWCTDGDPAFEVPVDKLLPAQQRAGAVDDDGIAVQVEAGCRVHICV